MERSLIALALLLAAAAQLPAAAGGSSATVRRVSDPLPSRYIVVLRPGVDPVATAQALGRAHGGTVGHIYTRALTGFSLAVPARAAGALAADPRVALVEEDGVVRAVATQSSPPWGLDRIDQRARPLSGSYTYTATGTGVRAYVIDTGIRTTHTDFGGRASSGYDAIDGGAASDCNGHGTHVAGTIGGKTYGVAKGVSLVAVRVLDCTGSGSTSGVIAGVDWVTRNAVKPAVANMSLGGGASSSLDNAVANSIKAGITYAIAAGNGDVLGNAMDACKTSPARVASALTVSATDSSDRKASWANYGSCVDLFAPGVSVKSAWYSSDTATSTTSGTSMAAPHVAGVAAAYLQSAPSAPPATVGSAITVNATANVVSSPGSGSPNKLLYSAFVDAGETANAAPVAGFTHSCAGLGCSFTDTSTDSDGTIAARAWTFGDGSTSSATNPGHSYAASGTYTVSLTVTDDDGAKATTSKSITVSSDPDPSTPTLTSGVALSDTNGARGTWKHYKISVPTGRSSLKVTLNGSSASCSLLLGCDPDLDLYVRRASKPTTSTYDCRGTTSSASESCTKSNPAADWWYVGVYVYSSSRTISYSVTATY